MKRTVVIKTAPTEEPVTLDEARAHLVVDIAEDDTLIGSLITAARQMAESFTGRAFVSRTLQLYFDHFPANENIYLPFPPVVSVTSVTYTDTNGDSQTFSASLYDTDLKGQPGRVQVKDLWPSTDHVPNAVCVEYVAGYGSATDVPQAVKQAMLLIIGDLYEHRESIIIGTVSNQLPQTAEMILWPYRDLSIA